MKINSILKKTIYDYRKSIIGWSIGILLIGIFYATIYPSVGGNQKFSEAFGQAPDAMKALIVSGEFFSTPDGFIHAEFFTLTMPLILCILAITIGSSLLAKEESRGTMELLLSRPVSRQKIVSQKIGALAIILLILSTSVWLGLYAGSLLVNTFTISLLPMAIAVANLGIMALAFGCLALMATSIKGGRSFATGIIGVYFILSFVVGTFAGQVTWLKNVESFSLFHYFNSVDILQNHAKLSDFIILITVAIIAVAVSIYAFRKRDTGN